MNVRSRLAMLLLACLCTTGVFIGCHKDNADKQQPYSNSTFTVKEARSHFYKQVRPAMALRQQTSTRKPGKLYPLWDKAKTYNAGDYLLVEVPAFYEKRELLTIRTATSDNATARTAAPPTKAELGSFNRLLFYKFKDGTITERIVTYIPDSSYMAHHQYDASHNYLWALDKDFSGYLVHCTLEGKPFMALKMKDAKIISLLDYNKAAARKSKENARWVEHCTTISITIGWETVCVITGLVDDPGHGYIGYESCQDVVIVVIDQVCETVWENEDPCFLNPTSPGCSGPNPAGGGGGDDLPPCGDDHPCPPKQPQDIVVGPAVDVIPNIHDYLATAFDLNADAKMIICTRQPFPGSRAVVSGSDLGNTFLTFEQMRNGNLVRRTIGFHPQTTVNLINPVSAPMQIGNDQTYYYNVQLEADITSDQFQQTRDLIDFASTNTFNIRGFNSQYLGYQIAYDILGTGITKTMGTLYGSAPNIWGAGDLGEDLKAVGGVAVPPNTFPQPDQN